jgi:hypothetical protein
VHEFEDYVISTWDEFENPCQSMAAISERALKHATCSSGEYFSTLSIFCIFGKFILC